jgi:hypothetical protein
VLAAAGAEGDLPQWLAVVAVAIAVALAGGVVFAIITGHWLISG